MKKSIIRLVKAIQYSYEGLKSAFISEIAFRQELLLFIVCVSALFVLDVSNLERAVMVIPKSITDRTNKKHYKLV
ncbi:MAG: diacylglycerol kinase [Wolbachia pipientis]